MAGAEFRNVNIVGLTGAVPKNIIRNRDLAHALGDETIERIIQMTGVEQMHKALPEQTAGDLGYTAAEELLGKLQIDRTEIGALVLVTGSPDYIFPSTSYIIHRRLGLPQECMAFDIGLQCSGFVYGLHTCASLLQSMKQRYLLLVVAESFKYENVMKRKKPDNSLAVLNADAGTAMLLERVPEAAPIRTELYADGTDFKMMIRMGMNRGFGLPNEVTEWSDGKERSIYDPYMVGMGTFAFATRKAPEAIRKFLSDTGTAKEEYDQLVLHQANKMIVERIAKQLKWSLDKVPLSITRYGNTSCASIPVTIVDQLGESDEKKPSRILSCGFGAGCSWGVASFEIMPESVFPMVETEDYFEEGVVTPF